MAKKTEVVERAPKRLYVGQWIIPIDMYSWFPAGISTDPEGAAVMQAGGVSFVYEYVLVGRWKLTGAIKAERDD